MLSSISLTVDELEILSDNPSTTMQKASKLDKLNVSENITQAMTAVVNGVSKKTRATNPDESRLRLYSSSPWASRPKIDILTMASQPCQELGNKLS